MATLTVRNIPDEAKHRFRQIAAAHGRSMEEHLRRLVIDADHDALVPASGANASGVSDMTQGFSHFPTETRKPAVSAARARIERLIELGRGLDDFALPPRETGRIKDVDFT